MNPTRQFIWNKTNGLCFYCGLHLKSDDVDTITRGASGRYESWMEVDHVHPRAKGGLDAIENMVPACNACNCTKGNRTLEEYRHSIALRRDGRPKLTAELVEWLTRHDFQFPPLPDVIFWFEDQSEAVAAKEAERIAS